MADLKTLIEKSQCFGRMYDGAQSACRKCEAWMACEKETDRYIASMPATVPEWAEDTE